MKSNQALDRAALLLAQPKKGFRANRDIPLYLLILPGFLLLLVFNYIPIFGIVISFQNFSPFLGIAKSPWIGFENFSYFLFDSKFWEVMKNTLLINLLQLIIGFPVPILFALDVYKRQEWTRLIQPIPSAARIFPSPGSC